MGFLGQWRGLEKKKRRKITKDEKTNDRFISVFKRIPILLHVPVLPRSQKGGLKNCNRRDFLEIYNSTFRNQGRKEEGKVLLSTYASFAALWHLLE